jgi:pSer/pThr/pTyr-binding forkhead associated (FHA) protein
MLRLTFRVVDGPDRGRAYANLEPPLTIGREEGNTIQLSDERVSRFHAKVQVDHETVVLTDLDSTNGTRVNGEDIQLRNLKYGDLIHVGRTVLVFGTREEISQRLKGMANRGEGSKRKRKPLPAELSSDSSDIPWRDKDGIQELFFALDPPELPERLSPGQAAQLAEVLEYLHITLRHLIASIREESGSDRITLDLNQWQNLLDLQCRLAEYLRGIGNPDSDSA